MKKSLVVFIITAQLTLVSWTTYGQNQNSPHLALSLPLIVSNHGQDRIVDWHPVRTVSGVQVLEIVDVKVAGKPIRIGQPFTADDDWLDKLTFRVRNVSGKTITVFGFGVAFPELNDDEGVSPMFSVSYGAQSANRDSRTRKPLAPDEEVDLRLPEDQLAIMRRISMRKIGTANMSKMNILSGLARFEDGSSVGGLSLQRRVSAKP
jgi:hypothetical protein